MEAYFDNSATTKVTDSVKDIVVKVMTEDYGNPSSMHIVGVEAEKYITKEMEKAEKVYSDELFDTFSFSWTNNTGNDIDMLEISYKGYDLNGQSLNLMPVYEENISNGETRKIKINTLEKNVDRIEIVSVDIRHVAQDGLHYGGCIPGMWYKLDK